jgi:hypothetical protein
MKAPDAPTAAGTPQRAWYQSLASQLLLAFILIVALTIAATLLSIVRFNGLDAVLHRLIDVSLPVVRLSLGIESHSTQVAETAAQLGSAENAVQLFEQNERLTQQIQELWSGLAELRAATGDTAATQRLQVLVAGIDTKLGELNRAATDRIALVGRREQLLTATAAATDAIGTALSALPAAAASDPELAAAMQALRVDANVTAALLTQAATATRPESLSALRQRYDVARSRLDTSLAAIASRAPDQATPLRRSVTSLLAQGDGPSGAFAQREQELGAARPIEAARRRQDHARPGRGAGGAGRTRVGRGPGELGKCDRKQPDLADRDRGREPAARKPDRVAVRVALRGGAADRARAQHDGDRARRPLRPAAGRRARRARRHEPGARGVPRQRPRNQGRQGRGREGAGRGRGCLAHQVVVPRQHEP